MLSTDHPNGGSFLSYPKLIRLLMDRAFREDQIGRANQRAIRRTALLDGLDREYTLNEIAIITRAAPARRLGLRDKGHLGIGADADVTIYHDRADREEMFATPRYVIKGGEVAVEEGELRRSDDGLLLSSRAAFDPEVSRVLEPLFGERYTVSFEHYPVRDPALREPARVVEAGRTMSGYVGSARPRSIDTFAEAFPMRYARAGDHGRHRRLGARGGALDDRLRHLGDRLQVRGGDRARARPRRRRRTAGRGSPCCCSRWTARGSASACVERVGQSVMTCPTTACFDGLPGRREDGAARRQPALLRRRLSGQQGDRRAALLADPGDGGRVSGVASRSGSAAASGEATS